jgi:hypothetical protein
MKNQSNVKTIESAQLNLCRSYIILDLDAGVFAEVSATTPEKALQILLDDNRDSNGNYNEETNNTIRFKVILEEDGWFFNVISKRIPQITKVVE